MKKLEIYIDGEMVYNRGALARTDSLLQLLEKLDLNEEKLQAKLMCRNLLTRRQLEIMKHVAAGEAAKVSCGKLGISQFTVQAHIRDIFDLIGAHRLPHAISLLGL